MVYYHSKYGYSKPKKKNRLGRILMIILGILIIISLIVGYQLYKVILKSNTWIKNGESADIFIPTGSDFNTLKTKLYENGIVVNRNTFEWLAKRKNLPNNIYPGRYVIGSNMSNNDLINLLRSGHQIPVNLTFNNIRTKEQLAKQISTQIEADSLSIIKLITDSGFVAQFGFDPSTVKSMFIPNTYELYWNTSAESLIDRMHDEYKRFWSSTRDKKAEEKGLTRKEVSTLASIIEKETNKNNEKPTMAGVYLNRLKYGWRLQADPTLVFAWGDFSIKRVLDIHKKLDSPYNTYMYPGLPPGPICIPSISSIDAVLNAEEHDYLFFCAKEDFSGYHVFAKTQQQHAVNANKYRRALNDRKILK
ncbi:MAG: endolytic transglycosylase MltG [Bacteroidales bacterium]|nr:endolytic transglycosylase MltG [Bacteroidales bacterium]